MSSEDVLVCRGVEKTYRDFWGRRAHPALRGLDLAIRAGQSYALLGPNGSGKTTALRIMLGLLHPTAGAVTLFGAPPTSAAARARVGFLPERSSLHGFLTCAETLDLFAKLQGVPRGDRAGRTGGLLDRVGLTDSAPRRVHALSHGMRRRLALAVALVGRPELLVLDEPTSGMVPLARESVLALFKDHVEGGGTLLVTSHLLGDLSGIAQRAGLLADGRISREGDLDDLLRRDGLREYVVRGGADLDASVAAAAQASGGEVVRGGVARATIEELFVETYRDRPEDAEATDGDT